MIDVEPCSCDEAIRARADERAAILDWICMRLAKAPLTPEGDAFAAAAELLGEEIGRGDHRR